MTATKIVFFNYLPKGNQAGIDRYVKNIFDHMQDNITCNFAKRFKILDYKMPNILQKIIKILCYFIPVFKFGNKDIIIFGGAHKLPLFFSKNIRSVVTIHDLVFKVAPETMNGFTRIMDNFFVPKSLKRADVIITVSKSTANDIAKYYPDYSHKVHVIPLAGNLQKTQKKFLHSIALPEKYILFVGTIEPRKNLDKLLSAYASLTREIKEKYKLVIVGGKGWGNVELKKKIESMNLQQNIVMTGYVEDSDLYYLYKNAYCLAMPSLYEGFGLPILEAHNFGVPVLTSDVSSMPEVSGKGSVLCDPSSAQTIANALQKILSDELFYQELSVAALKNAKKYSWQKTADLTLQAFAELDKIN